MKKDARKLMRWTLCYNCFVDYVSEQSSKSIISAF